MNRPVTAMTEETREYFRQCGAQGGRKAAKNMSKTERIKRAKRGASALARKKKAGKKGKVKP